MSAQKAWLDGPRTMREAIDRMAELRADEPYIINPETDRTVTFSQLQHRARDFSCRLLSLGLSKGDKVAFLLHNGPSSLEVILGAMYGGFVPTPLSLAAGQSPTAATLSHSDAAVVFVSDEHRDLLSSVITHVQHPLKAIPVHPDNGPDWNGTGLNEHCLPGLNEQDDALLLYTSGTTGKPKGVLFAHSNVLASAANAASFYELSTEDRSLCVLPIYHITGLGMTSLATLLTGGCLVVPRRFNVSSFWNWVVTYRCTWFALAPTIVSQLVNRIDRDIDGSRTNLSHVRFARTSTAPISPSLHKAFEEKFRLPLVEAMGMTEAGDILSTPPALARRKIGSPGVPRYEAKFVDEQGRELPPHHIGEMFCRGPSIMKGYYKDSAATAATISPDGWLKTGDLGYKDEDGYFFLTGRAKEIIIKGGENISPREIDETLESHPSVLEAGAVGVPDPCFGEEIIAYVVLKPQARCQEQELLEFCAAALGDFKTPTRIHFAEDLPRGPSGKLQRFKLLDRIRESHTDIEHGIPASAPDGGHSSSARAFGESRTAVEGRLAAIWSTLLQVTRVGPHDDFFALGGHSLLAASILARIRDAFQVSLPLRVLFEAPTVAELAQRIEAARFTGEDSRPVPIPSFHEGNSPLSFAQERLWFVDLFESGSIEYNLALVRRFHRKLVIAALERSFTEVIRRHAILRTTFPAIHGQPFQSVASPEPFSLTVMELSSLSEEEKKTEVARLAKQEALRPFVLAEGPLLRATLLRLDEEEHVLLVTVHHIVFDRWSIEVLFWELGELYTAFSTNQTPGLPELPIQYADLAAWQRKWLQGEILESQLAYWKKQLTGIPQLLEIPSDRPRPAKQTHRGAHRFALFSPSLAQALNQLSRREQVTLFMTLLAAFQTLLFRYTGQADIVVGSPTANRTRTETENLIGFFINMLVLRTDLSGNPTFRELLQRVQRTALGAYEHQDIPFEKLVAELRPVRTMSQSPLFQVVFHLRNVPERVPEFSGLQMEVLRSDSGAAQFDLTFAVREIAAGLEVEAEYNTDLFDADTIERMLGHYEALLVGIVADPDLELSKLPLLTSAERARLLDKWSAGERAHGYDRCVHELFEDRAAQAPDGIAVVFEGRQATYGELNQRANQLAHYLQKLGVGPEVLVGICLEHSPEMIITCIAVLKAGGAYVPLDPHYPKERLAFMINDAALSVLVTRDCLVKELGEDSWAGIADDDVRTLIRPSPMPIVCLEGDGAAISQESTENPISRSLPQNRAYVIYTSGSSGTPKGVEIQHASLVNLVAWHHRVYTITPMDRATLLASAAFDASVWELWPYLTTGARIEIPNQDIVEVPSRLLSWMAEKGITISFLPTPLARALMEEPLLNDLRLRTLLTGGDKLHRRLGQALPFCLANNYGPTENTVVTTWAPVTDAGLQADPPIGRPIDNACVYLLDLHLQPVPIGLVGELYIGGAGLARGYLNQPELTAEKFIPHSFSKEPGDRLYKSGDLGRYLPDGTIEFLGRIDHQVKIRGFRVELGEIEAVLTQYPGIQQAVAVACEDAPGDKRLVVYAVPDKETAPTVHALHSFLKQKLPDYMVPSAFVFLDALPLTPNGKVDRRALPIPDGSRPELEEAFVAPRTSIEKAVAGIWAEVLGVERVGANDNFFELGGHSLLATQVMSRVHATFRLELPLRTLFETPTVAGLAVEITKGRVKNGDMADVVASLESLSDEEAEQLLAQASSKGA